MTSTTTKYTKRKSSANGWFAVSRNIFDHHLVSAGDDNGQYTRMEAFLWIVAHAAWKPTKGFDGVKEVDLQPGELACSQRFLAEAWGWTRGSVRHFLNALQAAHTITQSRPDSTHASHRITLVNWEKYQVADQDERPPSAHLAPAKQPAERPKYNNNQKPYTESNNAHAREGSFWKLELNPGDPDYQLLDGIVRLDGKAREHWLGAFAGDSARLDLALTEISGGLEPHSSKPLAAQVAAGLARIAGRKREQDSRYANAVRTGRAPSAQPIGNVVRRIRDTSETFEQLKQRTGWKPPERNTP